MLTGEQEFETQTDSIAVDRLREYAAFLKTVKTDSQQGFTLRRSGDQAAAIAEMTDVAALFKSAVDAAGAKDHETAVALFSRVVELEPAHETAWYKLGRAWVRSGDPAKGVEAFHRQIEIDPYHAFVHSNLGWALEKLDDDVGAEAAYRAQIEHYPLNRYANAHLGELLQEQERCGEAVRFLESALSIKSDDHEARMRLGTCYLDLGRTDEGVDLLAPLSETTSNAWILSSAGYAMLKSGKYESAIPLLKRGTELDEDQHKGFLYLGQALHGVGKLDEAVAAFEHLIELDPKNRGVYLSLGRVYAVQGNLPAAVEALRQHLAIRPDDALGHSQLGYAYWSLDRVDEAIESLQSSLRTEPDQASVHGNLAALMFSRGEFAVAQKHAEQALALDAENYYANRTFGVILARQERYAEALPLLEMAQFKAPEKFTDQDILDYVRQQVHGDG